MLPLLCRVPQASRHPAGIGLPRFPCRAFPVPPAHLTKCRCPTPAHRPLPGPLLQWGLIGWAQAPDPLSLRILDRQGPMFLLRPGSHGASLPHHTVQGGPVCRQEALSHRVLAHLFHHRSAPRWAPTGSGTCQALCHPEPAVLSLHFTQQLLLLLQVPVQMSPSSREPSHIALAKRAGPGPCMSLSTESLLISSGSQLQ